MRLAPGLSLAFLLAFSASASAESVGVLSVTGDVQLRESSSAAWSQAKKGDILKQGSEILTGAQSACDLSFGRDNTVRIQSDALAVLTSLDPVNVELKSGRIFSWVRNLKRDSTFQVTTPTAVAVVRGTGWSQTGNNVSVFEDTVHVKTSQGNEIDVNEGQGVEIGDDGSLGDLSELTDEQKSEWSDYQQQAEQSQDGASGQDEQEEEVPSDEGFPVDEMLDAKEDLNEAADQKAIEEMLKPEKEEPEGGY